MKSAIAVFFASLISGALSFADFRPAVSDLVQILTGVHLCQENTLEPQQGKDCRADEKSEEQGLYLISDMNSTQDLRCDEAA
ncbi:hypothetical protein [Pontibacter amylolyticus]|uniref:Uncharacterized protein n=1 Tax=Pontibacter amylolyticus TaxID=1424080 RepID=A0ABQ1WA96_9BACT|nr:hypothetical protein [Pontibacter amylolyticus]GGG21227.1 hypothetical protein GCM10011323_26480 [Pontibacter amylolyticus]